MNHELELERIQYERVFTHASDFYRTCCSNDFAAGFCNKIIKTSQFVLLKQDGR
jgi:hypothetical protein